MVEWRDNELDQAGLGKYDEPLWIHKKKQLLSVQDVRTAAAAEGQLQEEQQRLSTVRDLAKTRCVPTSHCAGDEDFVQKGRQTLFINASWSLSKEEPENENHDEQPWIQWPWLVDIELPKVGAVTKPDPPKEATRTRPERSERPERPKRPERPERPEKKTYNRNSANKGVHNSTANKGVHNSNRKTKGSKKL